MHAALYVSTYTIPVVSVQVLLRLNTLPVLLSLTLGTSYGAYCLPVLLTLGFLFTAAFMASWPQMTPASMQGQSHPPPPPNTHTGNERLHAPCLVSGAH